MVGGDPHDRRALSEDDSMEDGPDTVRNGGEFRRFLAASSNQYHLRTVEREFPLAAKLMKGSIYVHDVMVGGQSIEEPTKMCHKAK